MIKEPYNTNELFVKNLRTIMKDRKISRKALASGLHVPYTTFCDWYNGRITPSIEKITLLANYLNIPLTNLISNGLINDPDDDLSNDVVKIDILTKIPFNMSIREAERNYSYCKQKIDPVLIKHGQNYFGLLITDDLMTPDFKKDDWVIFKETKEIDIENYYCVKENNGDAIIRKILLINGGYMIMPMNLNTKEQPRTYTKNDLNNKFYVLGIAKICTRSL